MDLCKLQRLSRTRDIYLSLIYTEDEPKSAQECSHPSHDRIPEGDPEGGMLFPTVIFHLFPNKKPRDLLFFPPLFSSFLRRRPWRRRRPRSFRTHPVRCLYLQFSPDTTDGREREERRGGERERERLRANLSTATDRPTATAQPATTHPVRNGRAIREKGCQTWRFLEPPSPAAQFQFLLYFAPFRASKKPMAFWG